VVRGEEGRGVVRGEVGWGGRFPVLPMLGVNTSVKRWVTAQCSNCGHSAAQSPAAVIPPLHVPLELLLKHIRLQIAMSACTHTMHAVFKAPVHTSFMQGSDFELFMLSIYLLKMF